MNRLVAYATTQPVYCAIPPYHPDTRYPELGFSETSDSNKPYELIRSLLFDLGYDRENYGTIKWNPLSTLIRPGNKVVINPNFVLSYNQSGASIFSVITHPSIIRALIDYSFLALKGEGKIVIADAPQMDCNWADLMSILRLDTIQSFYREKFHFDIEYYDLRNFELIDNKKKAYFENRRTLPGDPLGSIIINLGKDSEFYGLPHDNYYGADINREETIKHHHDDIQEYSVSKTILSADVVLSVPKMKTHKKVGVTLNVKGLVGINTNKNYLVHYRVGTPSKGGDQLPDDRSGYDSFLIKAQRFLYDKALAKMSKVGDIIYKMALTGYNVFFKPFKKVSEETVMIDSGNWHGNNSAWRMAADLAKIFYYADKNGNIQPTLQRKILCLVDGIVGGEKVGPLAPDDKPAGCIIMGENPFAVDIVTTRLMGFDPDKIKTFNILKSEKWDFGIKNYVDINLIAEHKRIDTHDFFSHDNMDKYFNFKAHPGWVSKVEI